MLLFGVKHARARRCKGNFGVMRRHARIVLRQLRISGQAASSRADDAANRSKYPIYFSKKKTRELGDHWSHGAVLSYESGGGGAVELEFVVLDRNRAVYGVLNINPPDHDPRAYSTSYGKTKQPTKSSGNGSGNGSQSGSGSQTRPPTKRSGTGSGAMNFTASKVVLREHS